MTVIVDEPTMKIVMIVLRDVLVRTFELGVDNLRMYAAGYQR